jgi:hypothetical protein
MNEKFVVWIKDSAPWELNGDGEMSQQAAERIARELKQAGYKAKALPADMDLETEFQVPITHESRC